MDLKTCRTCGIEQSSSEFNVGYLCRTCNKASCRTRYQANKVAHNTKVREWQLANPEKVKAAKEKNYQKRKAAGKPKAYYEANKEQWHKRWVNMSPEQRVESAARSKAYWAAHKEELLAKAKAKYETNPEFRALRLANAKRRAASQPLSVLEAKRRYAKTEKGLFAGRMKQNRRTRRFRAQGTGITQDAWLAIVAKFEGCCAYCCVPCGDLTVDHVVAISRGGAHGGSNMVPACRSCNSKKGARDVPLGAYRKPKEEV